MDVSVAVTGLTRVFGDFTAVDAVSFSVRRGEIFGFLGPNGAGKSTTIRMLCGLLTPSAGTGHVNGIDIITGQEEIKKNIGYLSQRFSLYDDLTAAENLAFFGRIYGLRDRFLEQRIATVTGMVGLGEYRHEQVRRLPVGIRQRLALATAVIHDPPVLFLDEPTSGVDPLMRRLFWEQIYAFSAAGKTIFVTTHYMDEAEHCERIALIIGGRVMAIDSPAALKEKAPHAVYRVRTSRYLEAFTHCSGAGFIGEAALFGTDLHLLAPKAPGTAGKIRKLLDARFRGAYTLQRITPTLEDVFVAYARQGPA